MKNKKRTAKQNIKGCLRSTSGLSLVELVVAVAILAALSSILLHAFLTSNTVTNKARKMSEATDCAQNIQETIEALSVENFFAAGLDPDDEGYKPDAVKMLDLSDGDMKLVASASDKNSNGNNVIHISGIKASKSSFDAKVTFASGIMRDANGKVKMVKGEDGILRPARNVEVPESFYLLNQKKVSDYKNPDKTYIQSYKQSTSNPDYAADKRFVLLHPDTVITNKERKIIFDIEPSETEPNKFSMLAYFQYIYTFDEKVKPNNNGTPPKKGLQDTLKIETPEIFLDEPITDKFKTVYFMYYPCYADEKMRTLGYSLNSEKRTGYTDEIEINNYDDLNVRIILIKMVPMISCSEIYRCERSNGGCGYVGGKWAGPCPECSAASTMSLVSGYITCNDYNNWDLSDYNEDLTKYQRSEILNWFNLKYSLDGYENLYQFHVKEHHSEQYMINYVAGIDKSTFLTNAGVHFSSLNSDNPVIVGSATFNGEIVSGGGSVSYEQISPIGEQTAELIAEGGLVNKERFDRVYCVYIELYPENTLGEEDTELTVQPLAEFVASKVK